MNNKLLTIKRIFFSLFLLGTFAFSNAQTLEEIPNPTGFSLSFFTGGQDGNLFFDYVDNTYYGSTFHYDGVDLSQLDFPPDHIFSFYSNDFNDNHYFVSFDYFFNGLFYEYDGTDLTELALPANSTFGNFLVNYNDIMYVSLFDANFNQLMYGYDGTDFTEIPNPTGFTFNNYITTFNDIMYLSFNDATFNTTIFSYDGTTLTEVVTPPGINFPFFVGETSSNILISFQGAGYSQVLYSFDGITFTEIPSPVGFNFGFLLGQNEDEVYLGYFDPTYYTTLFLYDGNTLTEMPSPAGFDFPNYVTNFDGKPYFNFFDQFFFNSFLFSWDGSAFIEVENPQPQNLSFSLFADTLDGKAYFLYFDYNFNQILLQLETGSNSLLPIDIPSNFTLANFVTSYEENLYFSFFDNQFNQSLSIFDGNNFTQIPNPTNENYSGHQTNDQGYVYLRYSNNNYYQGTLYRLASNALPFSEDNTVTTFINIPYFFESNDFVFTDSDGDILEGILITEVESVGNLLIDGAHAYVGDFIAIEDISKLAFFPNTNEEGINYDSFKFKVFDGNDYSEQDYTMFINVVDPATSTYEVDLKAVVNTFPNPASSFVNISILAEDNIDDLQLRLFSAQGQLLQNQSFNNIGYEFKHQLNTSLLPSGTYFLIGNTSKGNIRKSIVIKN